MMNMPRGIASAAAPDGKTETSRGWSVEYLFHTRNFDVQLAVGTFGSAGPAERVAAETPALLMAGESFYLQFASSVYLVPGASVLVEGDAPRLDSIGSSPDFAFVDGWVFPSRRPYAADPYVHEACRYWLATSPMLSSRVGLRYALLWHFRRARLRLDAPQEALNVYESCGKRVDALVDELLEEQWLAEVPTPSGASRLVPTTRMLTVWPEVTRSAN